MNQSNYRRCIAEAIDCVGIIFAGNNNFPCSAVKIIEIEHKTKFSVGRQSTSSKEMVRVLVAEQLRMTKLIVF